LTVSLIVIGVAFASSRFPDRIERPFGLHHRTVSHWPLLMLTLAALLALLTPMLVITVVDALSHDPSVASRIDTAAGPLAGLVAAGFAIGSVCHILGDAMTVGGAPLLGPFSRRDRWILPKSTRFHVYRSAPSPLLLGTVHRQDPSVADLSIRFAASAGTVLLALVHFSHAATL
jgi:hypothetical protein